MDYRQKDWYEERKKEGRCPRCGGEVERRDRVLCAGCREKQRLALRNRRLKNSEVRDKDKALSKRRAERLKEAGLCVNCGKEPAVPGRVRCEACLERARTYYRRAVKEYTRRKNGMLPITLSQYAALFFTATKVDIFCYIVQNGKARKTLLMTVNLPEEKDKLKPYLDEGVQSMEALTFDTVSVQLRTKLTMEQMLEINKTFGMDAWKARGGKR